MKITFGYWDEDALLATRVVPRAGVLLPNASILLDANGERVAIGMQCHQDIISVSAKFIATMWLYVRAHSLLIH